jgi:hypothetical protein
VITGAELRRRLDDCPAGLAGWKRFEDVCTDTLRFLFVPPLKEPRLQARSFSGIDRRDAIFPNRNFEPANNWGQLFKEFGARMILVEFKNYDRNDIGKEEINQTRSYMKKAMGKLAIVCCNQEPSDAAHIKRNSIYSEDANLILFVTTAHLKEMTIIKDRGDDPSDLIMDMVEEFYAQHE